MKNRRWVISGLLPGVLATEGCSLFVRDTSYHPVSDPAQFVSRVDNPCFPLVPGATYRYRSTGDEGGQNIIVSMTHDTRRIAGVNTTVVHDVVSEGDQVVEDTWDWYAQDRAGNVWYFGEDTKEYERGKVSTEGSWENSVNGVLHRIHTPFSRAATGREAGRGHAATG